MFKASSNLIPWLVISGVLVYGMVKGWFGGSGNDEPTGGVNTKPKGDMPENELLPITGTTLDWTEAKIIADGLFKVMHDSFRKSDLADIDILIRKCKNRADYNHVFNAFGYRRYSNFMGNGGDPFFSDQYDLTYWLKAELDENDHELLLKNNPQLNFFNS